MCWSFAVLIADSAIRDHVEKQVVNTAEKETLHTGVLILPESAPRKGLALEAAGTHLVPRDVSEGALKSANAAFSFSEYLIPHKWAGCAL